MAESSETKSETKSKASRQNILNFDISLRAFSFAPLSNFKRNLRGQLIGHFTHRELNKINVLFH